MNELNILKLPFQFSGLAKVGLIIIGICFLLLLVSAILLHSGGMSGISIVGIIIGVALILISNFFGKGPGAGGSGTGNGNGSEDNQTAEVQPAVPTVEPSVTPDSTNEIIIEVNTDSIFVDGVKCETSDDILAQLSQIYSDSSEITVVSIYADHKAYVLVIDTLKNNNYPYTEKVNNE